MERVFADGRDIDFAQAAEVLARSMEIREDWDEAKTREAFLNSSYAASIRDGNRTVAVGRAISDNHAWTLILDVAVLPEYREQGIGGELLERMKERFRGHELFTYTYADFIPFFEDHGFKRSRNSFAYAGEKDGEIDSRLLAKGFFLPAGYRFESESAPAAGNFPTGRKSTLDRDSVRPVYTEQREGLDYSRLNELLSLAFGGRERDPEVTRETFENSRYVEFALDGDKLIGCARAESDGVSQGFILNVAVDPAYQGLHIGREITSRLSAQMKGQNIFLNTHPGGVGFYNREGFRRNKTAMLYPAHPDMPEEIAKGFVLPKGYRFADETASPERQRAGE